MPLTGMRLTLPDGQVFRITSYVDTKMEQEWQYFFNGGNQATAVYERYLEGGGQQDRSDGLKQSVAAGAGAGRHVITVDAWQYVDSTDQWGNTKPEDPATTKRDELNNALNTTRISSDAPATLEVGEYADVGQFSPLPVVFLQSTVGVSAQNEGPNVVTVNLQMLESADLSNAIDSEGLRG